MVQLVPLRKLLIYNIEISLDLMQPTYGEPSQTSRQVLRQLTPCFAIDGQPQT